MSSRISDPDQRNQALQEMQRYGQRNQHPLLVGAMSGLLVGLLLGLFFAWIVWPVQWTGTALSHLSDKDRAVYIATVAEAYTSERSREAAQVAGERLSPFGATVEAELLAARQYYTENIPADGSPHVANINELIGELGLSLAQPDSGQTVEPATSAEQPAGSQAADTVVADEENILPAETGIPGWILTLLWLVTAFVLIAGGIWVLRSVWRKPAGAADQSSDQDDTVDEFIDEDDGFGEQPVTIIDPFAPIPTESTPGEHVADAAVAATAEIARSATGLSGAPQPEPSPLPPVSRQNVTVTSGSTGALLATLPGDDLDDYGFQPESEMEQEAGSVSTTIISEVGVEIEATIGGEDALPTDEGEADSVDVDLAITDGMAAPSEPSAAIGITVADFTAHFRRGFEEHDEAFRIEDQAGYAGDCGLGVNMKQGLVGQNPENVAVLDVWLVDAAESTDISYHALSLVSEYGAANSMAADLVNAGRVQGVVVSPKMGDRFQVTGSHLLLDCKIVDVRYARQGQPQGVFAELRVQIRASRRISGE